MDWWHPGEVGGSPRFKLLPQRGVKSAHPDGRASFSSTWLLYDVDCVCTWKIRILQFGRLVGESCALGILEKDRIENRWEKYNVPHGPLFSVIRMDVCI